MSDAGWFPSYRRMYDPTHWLAPTARDPSCRRDAWSDLLSMATYQPRETVNSGTLARGELIVSLRTLAARWHWHRSRVERFINALEVGTAIGTVRETPDGTVYRIVNYESYAVSTNGERDTDRDRNRDSGETAARQEQEVKKLRSTSTDSSRAAPKPRNTTTVELTPLLEAIRSEYPRRKGGQGWHDAWRAIERHLKAGVSPDVILAGTKRYAAFVRHEGNEGTPYVKQAATFFGPGMHFTEEWHVNGNGARPEKRAFLPGSAGSVLR